MTDGKSRGRRRASVALAAGLALTLASSPAFAAPSATDVALDLTKKQTITVTASPGRDGADQDISNRDLRAYKLADFKFAVGPAGGNNVTAYDLETTKHFATDVAAAARAAASETGSQKVTDIDPKNPMTWVVENYYGSPDSPWAGNVRVFLEKLAKSDSIVAEKAITAGLKSGNTQKFTNLDPGVYIIVDHTAGDSSRATAAAIPMMVATTIDGRTVLTGGYSATAGEADATIGSIQYKFNEQPVPHKAIWQNTEDVDNAGFIGFKDYDMRVSGSAGTLAEKVDPFKLQQADLSQSVDRSHGEDVTYVLETYVPVTTGYEGFHIGLVDTMDKGITFDPNSTEVWVQTKPNADGILLDRADWKQQVTDNADGTTTVRWVFGSRDKGIKGMTTSGLNGMLPDGATIRLVYHAHLDCDNLTYAYDYNDLKLEVSNNWNDWTKFETVTAPETPRVGSAEVNVYKTDMQGDVLDGAEFRIYEIVDGKRVGNALQLKKVADGEYRATTNKDLSYGTAGKDGTAFTLTDTFVTANGGKVKVAGLSDGTYEIEETKSPLGLVAQLPVWRVTVAMDEATDDGAVTVEHEQDANKLVQTGHTAVNGHDTEITVQNARNIFNMPATGAVGLAIRGVAAALAGLVGAGAWKLSKRTNKGID